MSCRGCLYVVMLVPMLALLAAPPAVAGWPFRWVEKLVTPAPPQVVGPYQVVNRPVDIRYPQGMPTAHAGHGFGVPTYRWGYFGARYRSTPVWHKGYYGAETTWRDADGY